MGGIIVDGRARLQFEGSIGKFEEAVVALSKFQKQFDDLKIEIAPLKEELGISVELQFKGTMQGFEKINGDLEKLVDSMSINTVPLPESIAVGTWPTPEIPAESLSWIINVWTKKDAEK